MFAERVMFCIFYSLFIIALNTLPASYSLKNKIKSCHQFSTCKCIFPTGRGINLMPLKQELLRVDVEKNSSILFKFCEDVSFGVENESNQCFHNVSICYVNNNTNKSISLGKTENMKIISDSQFLPISIQFTNGNITNIVLKCDEGANVPKLVYKSTMENVYNLQLESKHACVHMFMAEEGPSGGLSTGSVLIIIALVLTLVYFVGGMLTLKFIRGAEGKEMVPNYDFWVDLPYLVRDGMIFCFNGFRPQASYDRI